MIDDPRIEEVVSPEKATWHQQPTTPRPFMKSRRRLLVDDDPGIEEVDSPQKTRQPDPTLFSEEEEEEIVQRSKR